MLNTIMDNRPPTSTIPCKFFAEGSCRQGENCKFAHDVSQPPRNARGTDFRGRGRGRGRGDFAPRQPMDGPGEDLQRPYGRRGGSRNENYGPRQEYGSMNTSFESRGRGGFRGSNRGGFSRDRGDGYVAPRYEQRDTFKDNDRSFPPHSYSQPKNIPADTEQLIGSKSIELLSTNDRLKQLNIHRQNNGIAKLFISEALVTNDVLVMTVKEKNFVIVYDIATSTLMDSQIYINTNINDTILTIRKGMFGQLGTEFAVVGYTKFNEVAIKMSSYVLITPIASLFDHINFINIEISTEAAIDNVLISEEYLFVSCYNQSGLNRQ